MSFWIGVLIFAVGILVSVCLHEAGHLLTAKRFGMKATQYFAGFGPTVWSFRRGETEYGLKAIPAGGFVKIVGMTPLEPVDPAGLRTARSGASRSGSAPSSWWPARRPTSCSRWSSSTSRRSPPACPTRPASPTTRSAAKPVIGVVSPCIVQGYDLAKDGGLRACRASDPVSPATAAGLQHGDRIVRRRRPADRDVRRAGARRSARRRQARST